MLEENGALLGGSQLEHSYPHCWRCHKPVIFRATEQWFIGMETPVRRADGSETTFRQLAIEEIDKVVWDPAWGKVRITNMIATRPDWCISRQKIWDVPIAVFLCEQCSRPIISPELNRAVVFLIEREGIEAWRTPAADALLHEGSVCVHCGGAKFRKETDILDVWLDAGVSWLAVCESDPDLSAAYKAFQSGGGPEAAREVLYLEGGDQHRGWFHSSLLTSVALRGRAPYSHVATAGWTLDEQGRAMSKSLGNGVDPVDIANRMGGEIVRLWVASVDFREDMAASENLMQRCAELYKKLRNTFRFLLGNLHGFVPARDRVPEAELLPLDRCMLARTRDLAEKILAWYEAFEFHRVYQAVNEFAIVDLSAFYLDVLKDRMYTFAPTSQARRSAQTVLWQITEALVRLVAPILTFTADEIWEHLPEIESRPISVHLALFPKPEEIYSKDPTEELLKWQQLLLPVRNRVLQKIEALRKEKRVGKSLECNLKWLIPDHRKGVYETYLAALAEAAIVSKAEIVYVPQKDIEDRLLAAQTIDTEKGATQTSLAGVIEQQFVSQTAAPLDILDVEVSVATGTKCNRCWRYTDDTANYGIWQNVCERCRSALTEMGIAPPEANQ
jgi:isoleucyl-tRNA synthetase